MQLIPTIYQLYVSRIREKMPELPDATRARLLALGLSRRDADVLMDVDSGREVKFDGALAPGPVAYFDQISQGGRDPKVVVNWSVVLVSPMHTC